MVAEYAIALSSQHKTRCVYTSPIKVEGGGCVHVCVYGFMRMCVALLLGFLAFIHRAAYVHVFTND